MDYVYICRNGDNEELRYSIRSVLANMPSGKIWVVGGKPDWYIGPYIPVSQNTNKYNNVKRSLRTIVDSPEISETFVLMNDDFFAVKPVNEIITYNGGTLQNKIDRYDELDPGSSYLTMLRQTHAILKKAKIDDPLDFELHLPMIMSKYKLKRVLGFESLWRSAYGNIFSVRSQASTDVKVYMSAKMKPNSYDYINGSSSYLSTDDDSFKLFESMMLGLFPNKTYLEA